MIAEPPNLHEDWPIVRIETWKTEDRAGHVHTHQCIYRRSPSTSGKLLSEGEQCSYDESTGKYACNLQADHDNRHCTNTVGGVTAHQFGEVDNFKRVGQVWPTFIDVKHIYIWWERSSTSWDVENAESAVGFPLCTTCEGDHVGPHYPNHWFFDPGWLNDTRTYTYVWDMYWPSLDCDDPFGGWTESEAWHWGQYYSDMRTETMW